MCQETLSLENHVVLKRREHFFLRNSQKHALKVIWILMSQSPVTLFFHGTGLCCTIVYRFKYGLQRHLMISRLIEMLLVERH